MMSFQYGSDSPDIRNPFKIEGALYTASGTLVAATGIVSLFTLRSQLLEQQAAAGWVQLAIGLVLLAAGLRYIARGLLAMFRFYTGRGIPASLCRNIAKSEKHVTEPAVVYTADQLDQMLIGRKNMTFREPASLLDRFVYSLFPSFLYLPYAMRNYLHTLVHHTACSAAAVLVYLLALLSGSVGLTSLTATSYGSWLGIALSLYLIVLWTARPLSVRRVHTGTLTDGGRAGLVWVIALAIVLPALCELAIRQGVTLPEAPFGPGAYLALPLVLIPLLSAAAIATSKLRSELYDPLTEVSEYREHWQENVHPKDFFRSLDMELTQLRYKEIPNRVYRDLNPQLQMEGSSDKGSFKGDTIQETQPMFEEIAYSPMLRRFRLYASVAGHLLIVLGAVLLFALNYGGEGLSISGIYAGLYAPVTLWAFGSAAAALAHLYWAEMHFVSYLVQFQGEGTYTESKLSVGMAITDSTRTENTVVRTSFTPWLLVTKLVSSAQASSGAGNLSGPRFILSMHKSEQMLAHLVDKVRLFLQTRESIATGTTDKDIQSIQKIYSLNENTPAREALGAARDIGKLLPDNRDGNGGKG